MIYHDHKNNDIYDGVIMIYNMVINNGVLY